MASRPEPLDQSIGRPVDMSPKAISRRLQECADISRLCMKLSEAIVVGGMHDVTKNEEEVPKV